jgi:ketosteroid isomerase-like protein
MKKFFTISLMACCFATLSCNQQPSVNANSSAEHAENKKSETVKPAVDRAAEEASLKATELAWSETAGKKEIDNFMSFVTDDIIQLPPNARAAKGKDAVRKEWETLFGLKDSTVKWDPTLVQVSESGELGYTSGTYSLTFTDDKNLKVEEKGKYLEVWKKVDGKWKCHIDMYSADGPPKMD